MTRCDLMDRRQGGAAGNGRRAAGWRPAAAAALALAACGRDAPPPAAAGPAENSPPPAASAAAPPAERAAKPSPAVDVDFWFESPPQPGAAVKLGLMATARMDLPACEMAVLLPDDVPVADGEPRWRGPLARDRSHTLFVTIRDPDARRRVLRGRAEAVFPDGARVSRTAELALNGASPAGAEKPSPEAGVLKTNDRGERILEFPAEAPK